jgi:hypothetical protein
MYWLEAEKLMEIAEGILSAVDALREAQEAEAEGTVTAISYAYAHIDVDTFTRVIVIQTGNRFFAGDRDEVRRGRLGEWTLVWERRDIGITTGEDYFAPELRAWLLEHTRAEATEEREEQEDGDEHYRDGDEHYWDIYPW